MTMCTFLISKHIYENRTEDRTHLTKNQTIAKLPSNHQYLASVKSP